MELVLVSLRQPAGAAGGPDPETVVDILWANARFADGLEHVRAAPGYHDGLLRFALFLTPRSALAADAAALALCRRAIRTSPLLAGFGVEASTAALNSLSEEFED